MHFFTSCVALAVGFSAQGASSLRGEKHVSEKSVANAFVKALEFKRRLRVCNAYPYPTAMELFKGSEKLSDEPLAYKDCKDFAMDLVPGDKLLFKVGSANAGTFSVSDLPNNDAVLLLIVYRHDTLSTAVSFESHVYANLLNAQVAVVDTYKGTDKALLKINDHEDAKTSRSEELRFDSVVAVNPGKYDAVLVSSITGLCVSGSHMSLEAQGFFTLGFLYCITTAFHLAKLVRDRQDERKSLELSYQQPYQLLVVGTFVLSASCVLYGGLRLDLRTSERLFVCSGSVFAVMSALCLAKDVRDRLEIRLLRESALPPTGYSATPSRAVLP